MTKKRKVTCKQTLAVQTHRILPSHTNSHGNLYGGQLLYFLDNAASISFTRLTNKIGMTAALDNMNFLRPLPEGNSVCIESYATGAGNTSVEIFSKIIGEDLLTGERYLAATAFTTFVVIMDEEEKKSFQMPELVPESSEEKLLYAGYEKRRSERLAKQKSDQEIQRNLSIDFPWS